MEIIDEPTKAGERIKEKANLRKRAVSERPTSCAAAAAALLLLATNEKQAPGMSCSNNKRMQQQQQLQQRVRPRAKRRRRSNYENHHQPPTSVLSLLLLHHRHQLAHCSAPQPSMPENKRPAAAGERNACRWRCRDCRLCRIRGIKASFVASSLDAGEHNNRLSQPPPIDTLMQCRELTGDSSSSCFCAANLHERLRGSDSSSSSNKLQLPQFDASQNQTWTRRKRRKRKRRRERIFKLKQNQANERRLIRKKSSPSSSIKEKLKIKLNQQRRKRRRRRREESKKIKITAKKIRIRRRKEEEEREGEEENGGIEQVELNKRKRGANLNVEPKPRGPLKARLLLVCLALLASFSQPNGDYCDSTSFFSNVQRNLEQSIGVGVGVGGGGNDEATLCTLFKSGSFLLPSLIRSVSCSATTTSSSTTLASASSTNAKQQQQPRMNERHHSSVGGSRRSTLALELASLQQKLNDQNEPSLGWFKRKPRLSPETSRSKREEEESKENGNSKWSTANSADEHQQQSDLLRPRSGNKLKQSHQLSGDWINAGPQKVVGGEKNEEPSEEETNKFVPADYDDQLLAAELAANEEARELSSLVLLEQLQQQQQQESKFKSGSGHAPQASAPTIAERQFKLKALEAAESRDREAAEGRMLEDKLDDSFPNKSTTTTSTSTTTIATPTSTISTSRGEQAGGGGGGGGGNSWRSQPELERAQENNMVAYRWPFIALVGFIFLGAAGNILVCMAIWRERRLQTATNYFLLSLAVADLLVCTLVMPFGIIYEFYGRWPFEWRICNLWVTCDVLTCSSSILHMCFISVGRYLGIRNPLHARQANLFVSRRAVLWRIAIAWILAALIASPITMMSLYDHRNIVPSASECAISNKYFLMFGSMLAFFIPMFAMVPSYIMTVRLLSRRAKFVRNNSLQLAGNGHHRASATFLPEQEEPVGGGVGGGGQENSGTKPSRGSSVAALKDESEPLANDEHGEDHVCERRKRKKEEAELDSSGRFTEMLAGEKRANITNMLSIESSTSKAPPAAAAVVTPPAARCTKIRSSAPILNNYRDDDDDDDDDVNRANENIDINIDDVNITNKRPLAAHPTVGCLNALIEPEEKNFDKMQKWSPCGLKCEWHSKRNKKEEEEEEEKKGKENENMLRVEKKRRHKHHQHHQRIRCQLDCCRCCKAADEAALPASDSCTAGQRQQQQRRRQFDSSTTATSTSLKRERLRESGEFSSANMMMIISAGKKNQSKEEAEEEEAHSICTATCKRLTNEPQPQPQTQPHAQRQQKMNALDLSDKWALVASEEQQQSARRMITAEAASSSSNRQLPSIDCCARTGAQLEKLHAASESQEPLSQPKPQCNLKQFRTQSHQQLCQPHFRAADNSFEQALIHCKSLDSDLLNADYNLKDAKFIDEDEDDDDDENNNNCSQKLFASNFSCNRDERNEPDDICPLIKNYKHQQQGDLVGATNCAAINEVTPSRILSCGGGGGFSSFLDTQNDCPIINLEKRKFQPDETKENEVCIVVQAKQMHLEESKNNNNISELAKERNELHSGSQSLVPQSSSNATSTLKSIGFTNVACNFSDSSSVTCYSLGQEPEAPAKQMIQLSLGAGNEQKKTTTTTTTPDTPKTNNSVYQAVGQRTKTTTMDDLVKNREPLGEETGSIPVTEKQRRRRAHRRHCCCCCCCYGERCNQLLLATTTTTTTPEQQNDQWPPLHLSARSSKQTNHNWRIQSTSGHVSATKTRLEHSSDQSDTLKDEKTFSNHNLVVQQNCAPVASSRSREDSQSSHKQWHHQCHCQCHCHLQHHHHHPHHHHHHHHRQPHHHHHYHQGRHKEHRSSQGHHKCRRQKHCREQKPDRPLDMPTPSPSRKSFIAPSIGITLSEPQTVIAIELDDPKLEASSDSNTNIKICKLCGRLVPPGAIGSQFDKSHSKNTTSNGESRKVSEKPVPSSRISHGNAELESDNSLVRNMLNHTDGVAKEGTSPTEHWQPRTKSSAGNAILNSLDGRNKGAETSIGKVSININDSNTFQTRGLTNESTSASLRRKNNGQRRPSNSGSQQSVPTKGAGTVTPTPTPTTTTAAATSASAHFNSFAQHSGLDINEPPQMIRYLGSSMQVRSEQKATKVLGVVFFTFVICWTPFFVINFTQAFVEREELSKWISNEMMTTFLWLGYISSTINPVIYTVFNRNFRRAFREIILCRPPTHRRYRLRSRNCVPNNEQSKSLRLSQYGRQFHGASIRGGSGRSVAGTGSGGTIIAATGAANSSSINSTHKMSIGANHAAGYRHHCQQRRQQTRESDESNGMLTLDELAPVDGGANIASKQSLSGRGPIANRLASRKRDEVKSGPPLHEEVVREEESEVGACESPKKQRSSSIATPTELTPASLLRSALRTSSCLLTSFALPGQRSDSGRRSVVRAPEEEPLAGEEKPSRERSSPSMAEAHHVPSFSSIASAPRAPTDGAGLSNEVAGGQLSTQSCMKMRLSFVDLSGDQ